MPSSVIPAIAVFISFAVHRARRTSVGVLVLDGTELNLENDLTIGGDVECSDGDCPSTTKESLYDFETGQMCPVSDDNDDGGDGGDDGDDESVCAASVCVLCDLLPFTNDQLRCHTAFYLHACCLSMPDTSQYHDLPTKYDTSFPVDMGVRRWFIQRCLQMEIEEGSQEERCGRGFWRRSSPSQKTVRALVRCIEIYM